MNKSGPSSPQSVAALLPRITCDQGWQQQLDRHRLFLNWERLVDRDIGRHARPVKIVSDVLWLEVDNSAWMQQLQFQKIQLLETLNRTLRLSRLADIRFLLADSRRTTEPDKAGISFVQPDPADRDAFHDQIAVIEDKTIRDALMSLWYQSHSCRRE